MPVYHPPVGNDLPVLMTPKDIEGRLQSVVLDVEELLAKGEKAVPIGVLSANAVTNGLRYVLAPRLHGCTNQHPVQNLHRLYNISPTNYKSHQAMLQTVMGLSLEHTTYAIPAPSSASSLPPHKTHTRTPEQTSLDSHLHTTRGTPPNVGNRFYDKAFMLIVDPSTRAGATGEHSPCNTLVPSIVTEYRIVQGVEVEQFGDKATPSPAPSTSAEPTWERLDRVADERTWKESVAARERANRILQNSDDSVHWFIDYGTDWIKGIGTCPATFLTTSIHRSAS